MEYLLISNSAPKIEKFLSKNISSYKKQSVIRIALEKNGIRLKITITDIN